MSEHTLTLRSANNCYGSRKKNFVAQITGRSGRGRFGYDFLGGDEAVATRPGLYVERDIDRRDSPSDTFYLFDGTRSSLCEENLVAVIADALDDGTSIDWTRRTTEARLADARSDLRRSRLIGENEPRRYPGWGPAWGEADTDMIDGTVKTWRVHQAERIARLEAELATDPRAAAIAQARELITAHHITADELGLTPAP